MTLAEKIKVVAFACVGFGIKIAYINMKPKLLSFLALPNEPLDSDKINLTRWLSSFKVDEFCIRFALPWKKLFVASESANLIEVALDVDLQVVLK